MNGRDNRTVVVAHAGQVKRTVALARNAQGHHKGVGLHDLKREVDFTAVDVRYGAIVNACAQAGQHVAREGQAFVIGEGVHVASSAAHGVDRYGTVAVPVTSGVGQGHYLGSELVGFGEGEADFLLTAVAVHNGQAVFTGAQTNEVFGVGIVGAQVWTAPYVGVVVVRAACDVGVDETVGRTKARHAKSVVIRDGAGGLNRIGFRDGDGGGGQTAVGIQHVHRVGARAEVVHEVCVRVVAKHSHVVAVGPVKVVVVWVKGHRVGCTAAHGHRNGTVVGTITRDVEATVKLGHAYEDVHDHRRIQEDGIHHDTAIVVGDLGSVPAFNEVADGIVRRTREEARGVWVGQPDDVQCTCAA